MAERKMASVGNSSKNEGDQWVEMYGHFVVDSTDGENEDVKPNIEDQGGSMKLQKKDMNVYGCSPCTEEFVLAGCEVCGMFIKLPALQHHYESKHKGMSTMKLNGQANLSYQWTAKVANNDGSKNKKKVKTKVTVKKPLASGHKGSSQSTNGKSSGKTSNKLKQPNTNPVVKVERMIPGIDTPYKVIASRSQNDTRVESSSCISQSIKSESSLTPVTREKVDDRWAESPFGQTVKALETVRYSTVVSPANPVTTVAVSAPCVSTLTTQATSVRTSTSSSSSSSRSASYHVPPKSSQELASMLTKNSTFPSALAPALFPVSHSPSSSGIVSSSSSSFVVSGGSIVSSSTQVSSSKKKAKARKFLPCKDREFDPDVHCGVLIEATGKQCTRSLTCKTHSLRLQREVPGRSKTLDELLAERKMAKEASDRAVKKHEQLQLTAVAVAIEAAKHNEGIKVAEGISPFSVLSLVAPKDAEDTKPIKMEICSPPENAVFKRIAVGKSMPPGLHIRERSSSLPGANQPSSTSSLDTGMELSNEACVPSIDQKIELLRQEEKSENSFEDQNLPHILHFPRPAAMNTFGLRRTGGRGTILNSRRQDCLRACLHETIQTDSHPPPPKKVCMGPSAGHHHQPLSVAGATVATSVTGTDGGLAPQRPTVSFTIGNPLCAGQKTRPVLKPGLKSGHYFKLPAVVMASGASGTRTPVVLSIPTTRAVSATSIVGITSAAAVAASTANTVLTTQSELGMIYSSASMVPSSRAMTEMSLPATMSQACLGGVLGTAPSSDMLSFPVSISTGAGSSDLNSIDMAGLNIPLSGNITLTGGAQDTSAAAAVDSDGTDVGASVTPTLLGVSGAPNTIFLSSMPALASLSGISTPAGSSIANIVGLSGTNLTRRVSATSASKSLAGSSNKVMSYPNPSLAAALLETTPSGSSKMATGNSSTGSHPAVVSLSAGLSTRLLKRKHDSSQAADSCSGQAAPSTLQFPGNGSHWKIKAGPPGLGLMGANGIRLSQAQSATLLMPVSSIQSSSPSLSAVTFASPAAVGLTSVGANFKHQKVSKLKSVNFVLTRADAPAVQGDGSSPGRFNGQYLNVSATGTQLAHLAAVQAVSATAEDKSIKRNQLAKQQQQQQQTHPQKLQALRGASMLRAIPASAVLVDGSMQGAVLTPVSLGGGQPTLLMAHTSPSPALTSLARQASTMGRSPHTIARTLSTSATSLQGTQVTGSVTNGIPSSGESLHLIAGSSQQRRALHAQAMSSKVQKQVGCTPTTTKTLQVTGLAQQSQATPICPGPNAPQITHFSIQGGRLQSLPVINSICHMPSASQQASHTIPPPPAPALLVAGPPDEGGSSNSGAGGAAPGGIPAEFSLQTSMTSSSSRVVS